MFICVLQFPEGNIGEANQRIAKGVPVGRAPAVAFRNQHASYAVTWFVPGSTVEIGTNFSPIHFSRSRYSLSAFTSFLLYKLISRGRASHITPFGRK